LEAQLERREAVKAAGKEFLDLDGAIKARLRGVESGIIGKFQIEGWWGKQSRVELPAALKKQYTVTDPRGRFTLEVTKVVA
jgi:FAD/FMN-containing dehydrogenase